MESINAPKNIISQLNGILCRSFQGVEMAVVPFLYVHVLSERLHMRQKCLQAYVHPAGINPLCSNTARVPSTTARTARSATPLVCGIPGVETSEHQPFC